MKWHDDLSKWQERLGQVGGLLSVGAGFVLSETRGAEPPAPPQPEPAVVESDPAPPPLPDQQP